VIDAVRADARLERRHGPLEASDDGDVVSIGNLQFPGLHGPQKTA